jgi:hypothetical protein
MATASILVPPLDQWIDSNGAPLAGGKVFTYQPGTSTPTPTYEDADMTTANANPVVLDSAGRAAIYSDAQVRFVVQDSNGNQIYDALTAGYLPLSDVNSFILPALAAPDATNFLSLSGVTAQLQAAIAAIELMGGPTGPAGAAGAPGPTGPTGPAGSAADAPQFVFNPGPPATGYLRFGGPGSPMIAFGTSGTDGGGNATVTFATPFVGFIGAYAATAQSTNSKWFCNMGVVNNVSMSVRTANPEAGGDWYGSIGFSWWVIGV